VFCYRDFSLPSNFTPKTLPSLKLPVHSVGHKKASARSARTGLLCTLEDNNQDKNGKEYDYAILVLGVTGVGKSTMCNFFFDEDVFYTVPGVVRGTSKCNAHCHPINGKNIMFIDSPGFSDTVIENKERIQEMGKALLMARNGVHAIIVCLNGEARFTEADKGLVDELKRLETSELQSVWAYTFLVFTHGRNMGKTEPQRYEIIDKWKADPNCPPLFLEVLDKVQNRLMVIESLMEEKKYMEKCHEFVRLIEQVHTNNNETCYTHRLFSWARDKYEEVAKKQKERIHREKEQQEGIVKSQLDMLQKNTDLITQLENEKSELANRMQEIESELHKAELELKDKDHKIDQYEESIKTIQKNETIKLQDAFQKLEIIKQEKKTVEEMVENKQRECSTNRKIIQDKENAIKRESNEKQKIKQQLENTQETISQLTAKTQQLLHNRQVMGEPETLHEALELMTKEIDKAQNQLDAKEKELKATKNEVTQLTEQIDTKEGAITSLTQHIEKYSVRGIPIPFTSRKVAVGLAPRHKVESNQK